MPWVASIRVESAALRTMSDVLSSEQLSELDDRGFVTCRQVISRRTVSEVLTLLDAVRPTEAGVRTRRSSLFALRHVFRLCPEVARKVNASCLPKIATRVLGKRARPVRTLLFAKPADANWSLGWHQDLTIAVEDRPQGRSQDELAGFGRWSVKAGVDHVQPPTETLESCVTLRVHLDSASQSDGALRVIPGSHRRGRLSPEAVARMSSCSKEAVCEADVGDVLVMRPLLLHRSPQARGASRRRVLHLEYSSASLPEPLAWLSRP